MRILRDFRAGRPCHFFTIYQKTLRSREFGVQSARFQAYLAKLDRSFPVERMDSLQFLTVSQEDQENGKDGL